MAASPWGGSEELWSRAAVDLVRQGIPVSASIHGWSQPHERIAKLAEAGIKLQFRPNGYPIWRRLHRKLAEKSWTAIEVEKLIASEVPALMALSDGGPLPAVDLLERCVAKQIP